MATPRPTKSYVEEWKRLWEPDLEAIAFNGATCDPTRVDPKVLQWVKRNCSHQPHFIKIVNYDAAPRARTASRCKLRFPTPFVQQHFRELERVAKLENEDGKTWKVAFNDAARHPSWQQGWFQFATDNSLKTGDVIVFVLVGKSHFRFTHFDKDGNETSHNTTTCTPTVIAAVMSSDSSQKSDAEDEHRNSARNSKRAPPPVSKHDRLHRKHDAHDDELVMSSGLGFGRHGHVASHQQCAPTVPGSPSRKRRRLCKVGEKLKMCRNRGNPAVHNDAAHHFEEEPE